MRKLLFLVAAFAAACGGGSSGGGGASGTVGGKSFSPADVKAVVAGTGSTPCTLPNLGPGGSSVPAGIKAFALQFTSYADACGDFSSGACKLHQNAQTVTVIFARLNPPSFSSPTPSEPVLTTGTYTVSASIAQVTPEQGGTLYVAFADALATNATCLGTPSPSVQGGTLRVDSVTGPITGSVSLTFEDGSKLAGDFSAPICSNTLDVCGLANAGGALCTSQPSCVP